MLYPENHTFAICAYKVNPYLEGTLKSILSQSVLGKALISTSTPNEHIEKIANRYDVPLVVNPSPHYAGDDWNYAYDSSKTALVTIAHQDDIYDRDYLEKILAKVNDYDKQHPLMLFTDYYEIRDDKKVDSNAMLRIKNIMNTPFRHKAINGIPFVKKRVLSFGDSICCPSVCYVKQNLGDSIFDTTFVNSSDYKTFVDFARIRGNYIYIPERLMGHRIYAESATTLNLAEDIRKREDEQILSTLWPKPVARIINKLYAQSEKSNVL